MNPALEAERELAEEAKERKRQAAQATNEKRWGNESLVETFPQATRDDPEPYRSATPTTHTAKAGQTKKPKRSETDERASKSREQAAKLAGTNSSYVSKAKLVEAERPDLAEQVRRGTLSLEKAIKQIKAEQKAAERTAEVAAMQLEVKGNYAPDIIHGDALESLRACWETGAQVKIAVCKGEGSLIEFVLEQNLHRRDLDQTQKAFLALRVMEAFAKEAREKQRQAAHETNVKRQNQNKGTLVALMPQAFESEADYQPEHRSNKRDTRKSAAKSRDKAAQVVGASARYVQSAKKIATESLESC